jgi:hypothetical protein
MLCRGFSLNSQHDIKHVKSFDTAYKSNRCEGFNLLSKAFLMWSFFYQIIINSFMSGKRVYKGPLASLIEFKFLESKGA